MEHASVMLAVRILVIEDNASDVFLLDRALKKQDFPFELVHLPNGGEALAFIRRQGAYSDAAIPNLILLDLNLSKYTGADILHEIRSARHLAGSSGMCVEFFAIPSRRIAAKRHGRFAVHPQAYGVESIHGNRQNHQGSADGRLDRITASRGQVPRLELPFAHSGVPTRQETACLRARLSMGASNLRSRDRKGAVERVCHHQWSDRVALGVQCCSFQ